ncbi:HIT domain-containing protein [Lysobacter sp. KIS68-7]|uniref:HIT domain-containing protein n=1 Tax=Lysobacter sp. KIS68-7 TaxID=2904252 RepID=UPI001E36B1DD|nr:HIT domain-containing protein [Lysobacter sp. KIS68-7]UHQ18646.1 HIT domain-containing protein [Lysobacter sp. KIS68-7]
MKHHPQQEPWHLHPQLADDTHPVDSWPLCEVRLMDDANHPWLILVPRVAGATEVTDLSTDQQANLMREIDRAARTLRVFRPRKLNVAALGNLVPQLHVHVIARYEQDIAWPRPVWGMAAAQPYAPEALIERIQLLRDTIVEPES